MAREGGQPGTIGFRVKTGRATAVLMGGTAASPRVLLRHAVDLCDPKILHARQPYHAALGMPREKAAPIVRRATEAAKAIGIRAVRDLADELRGLGHDLRAVGLVVGSDIDPKTLTNDHMRAHALEGRLFREVLEAGAAEGGVPCLVLVEREAYARAAAALRRTPEALKSAAAEFGRTIGRPWGAEEKTAALAAWVALAR